MTATIKHRRDCERNLPWPENGRCTCGAEAAAAHGSGRRIRLTPASRIPLRAPRWLWDTSTDPTPAAVEGRIPAGALTIGAGRAGIGKSQHAAWLAAKITRGVLPGCHYGVPRSVIYAAAEDSWQMTIAPRLVAAGADLDRVYRIEVADDDDPHARLTLPADTHLLEQAITGNDVALIVLDPLLSLIDATINDYRAREVRDALEPLLPIADRTGCALFGIAHFTKATGSDPLLLIAGSGAFGQLVRAGIGYARDDSPGDDGPAYVMSTIKSNLGREDLPSLGYRIDPAQVQTTDGPAWVSRLTFTGAAARSVHDLLRDGGADEDRSSRDDAASWLRDYLTDSGGEAPSVDIKKAGRKVGIAERTLDRAKATAGVTTARRGFGKGAVYVWQLACTPHARHARQDSEQGVHGEQGVHASDGDIAEIPRADQLTEPAPSIAAVPDHGERLQLGATGRAGATAEIRGLHEPVAAQSRQSRQSRQPAGTGTTSCPKHPDTPINTANGRCPLCILATVSTTQAGVLELPTEPDCAECQRRRAFGSGTCPKHVRGVEATA